MGRTVKNSLELIIKQVRLEGGFERGGRIRVAECLRQTVPDRWSSRSEEKDLSPNIFVFTRGRGGGMTMYICFVLETFKYK